MEKNVLLAMPISNLYREIKIILQEERFASICEVLTKEEASFQLASRFFDLVIVHYTFGCDLTQIRSKRFILITNKPDKQECTNAYIFGAQAYLSNNVPGDILRFVLIQTTRGFLIDPVIVPYRIKKSL